MGNDTDTRLSDLLPLEDDTRSDLDVGEAYDTYKKARKMLKRDKWLTLKDVAAEDGYFMFNEHNAYADVWGLLHAFSFLKQKEGK